MQYKTCQKNNNLITQHQFLMQAMVIYLYHVFTIIHLCGCISNSIATVSTRTSPPKQQGERKAVRLINAIVHV
jgi:hypothetical protein